MRKFHVNWGVLGAAVAMANACGGQSVEQVSGDDSGAAGGGVNVGGAAGRSVGGGGAAGRSVAGRGAAGRRPGAGNGGDGGDAGGFDVGGAPVLGGTGSGASGNYPSVIASSPNCECVAESADSFACVIDLASSVVGLDGICDRLDWVTRRSTCGNAAFLYSSVEGDENEYELVVDASGTPIYYRASGYVRGCGLDRQYQAGSIVGGTKPTDCSDEYTCAPCADGVSGVPACPACTPDPHQTDGVTLSLDEYCQWNYCPESIAAARTRLATSCDVDIHPRVTSGCGSVEVRRELGFGMVAFYYDETSGDLVGLLEHDDLPHGPCNSFAYRVGDVPTDTCTTATVCEFCTSSGDGAAGAGGEAGSGSTTDLCPP